MYEPHEYCLALPDMKPNAFRELLENIRTNGLLNEITLYEGKILDGRHRYRACLELQLEPRFDQYLGRDPAGDVISKNVTRRHLSRSQLGMVGAKLAEVESERARRRQEATQAKCGEQVGSHRWDPTGSHLEDTGKTAAIISQKLGIGKNTVQRAINVRKRGTPEVVKAVEEGRVTVNEGNKIVELKPRSQTQIVAIEDKKERNAALGTRLQQRRTKKSIHEHRQVSGDAYVPGTPYVKRLLARAEMMLNDITEEAKSDDPTTLVRKFFAEFDWSSESLKMQLAHCEKLFSICLQIQSELMRTRAA